MSEDVLLIFLINLSNVFTELTSSDKLIKMMAYLLILNLSLELLYLFVMMKLISVISTL